LTAPASSEVAYRIQDQVFSARYPGVRPAAWKAGAASPSEEQSAAPIGVVRASPATAPASDFHMIGIEAEVAFRLSKDLPAAAQDWDAAELFGAVGSVFAAIEICDTRLSDWKTAPPLWKLADFQLNGLLVTGSGTANFRALDFGAQGVELWVNDRKTAARTGTHPMGDPWRVLRWAASHCATRSDGLKAGDIVTTGSWTGMDFVSAGDKVLARFPGIGEASVRIV
jgi:2-keto-4-pentenoate hydratase